MIVELFFSDIKKSKWNFLVEQNSGGLGIFVYNLITKLEDYKKKYPHASSENLTQFVKSLGLKPLGVGNQRSVFSIDDDHVIKIAWNDAGYQANSKEANPKVQSLLRNFVPKVYRADPNGAWIVMDKVTSAEDVEATGMDPYTAIDNWFASVGFPESIDFLQINEILFKISESVENGEFSVSEVVDNFAKKKGWSEEQKRDFLESDIFSMLVRSTSDFDKSFFRVIGDLGPSNVGWDSDGRPVILDWG